MRLLFLLLLSFSVSAQEFIATDKASFLSGVSSAGAGDVVYVEGMIDLSDEEEIDISSGVTIKSNRSKTQPGALLYTTTYPYSLFKINGPGIVFENIRLNGPDPERRTDQMAELTAQGVYYSLPLAACIRASYSVTIKGSEIWGWPYAAIRLDPGSNGTIIKGNYIHHNQRSGLGYGVMVVKAGATIENNKFEWNRHDIAGTGEAGTYYTAKNNISNYSSSHAFDMHGQGPGGMATDLAGDYFDIQGNKFLDQFQYAVKIRGVPASQSTISRNCYLKPDTPFVDFGNVTVANNQSMCF